MSGAFAGERAVVIGFGGSGRAAAEALLEEGAEVRVTEARPAGELAAVPAGPASDDGRLAEVEVLAGGHRPEHLEGATLVVTSPGVREGAPVLQWARQRRLPVWSELELGARLCRVPFVAVTGTNGKTTTVELLASMMRAAGLDAAACGNVGYPFSTAARRPYTALAVEVSSFQLRFARTFHPTVSVLLNLAPDHLDWHGSFSAYAAAKARVYANQSGADVHVGNRDDAQASRISGRAPCRIAWFREGPPEAGEVGAVDGQVVRRGGAAEAGATGSDLQPLGRPEVIAPGVMADAAAASAAAIAFGLPAEAIEPAIGSFGALPHRGQVVAEVEMVKFLDDSKATNPHAALAALEGMSHAVLIAGGLAKGVDLAPLAAAAPHLDAVVAIGEAAPALAEVFEGLVPVSMAASIEEAVRTAFDLALPDRPVLLAPACASQDMFRDYRERGERFAAAARALSQTVGRSRA